MSYPIKTMRRQRGVVIIVALFVVALVAVMAYSMMARLARDTRRTTLILREVQATYYARGSVAWAIDQLKKRTSNVPIQSPLANENGYHIVSILTGNLVKTEVTIDEQHLVLYTQLERQANGDHVTVNIVKQSKEAW